MGSVFTDCTTFLWSINPSHSVFQQVQGIISHYRKDESTFDIDINYCLLLFLYRDFPNFTILRNLISIFGKVQERNTSLLDGVAVPGVGLVCTIPRSKTFQSSTHFLP